MTSKKFIVGAALCCLLLTAPIAGAGSKDEPEQVVVQHVLIGFKRSVPNKKLDRTRKQAEALALEVYDKAESGEEFGALVSEYTDDSPPGMYVVVNKGIPKPQGAYERSDLVPRFGDVAFSLEVDEIGLARYSAGSSPFGWHIIKRLE